MNAELLSKSKAFGKDVLPYRPILLKGILARFAIAAGDLAAHIKQQNGTPLSRIALVNLMNYNFWPKRTRADDIESQIVDYLRGKQVPQEDIARMWELDATDHWAHAHPGVLRATNKHVNGSKGIDPLLASLIKTKGKPMLRESLTQAARKTFQLFRNPFIDEIQGEEDLFMSADQRYIREAMYAVATKGGLMAVVGESGSGKSILRKDLMQRIARNKDPVTVIYPRIIDKGNITARTLCEAIIEELSPGTIPRASNERIARQVESMLKASYQGRHWHCLVIEEAQDLEVKALKLLKRFFEIEVGYTKMLSILLIGQPELRNKLDEHEHPEAREFIRRCELATLEPLDNNLEGYLKHKFERVNVDVAQVFAADAYDAMRNRLTLGDKAHRFSMVYPLVVNNLAMRAMNVAANIGKDRVTAQIVNGL